MHGMMTARRGDGAPGGGENSLASTLDKLRDKDKGGDMRGKGKMVCAGAEEDSCKTQTFAANMQVCCVKHPTSIPTCAPLGSSEIVRGADGS